MGWDGAQTALAVVAAFAGDSSDSFAWSTDAISFTQDDGRVEGSPVNSYAATFTVKLPGDDRYAWARFDLQGVYAGNDRPPEMGNCHVRCVEQSGWEPWVKMAVVFSGMPSAVGSAEDPRLQFRCHAEISIDVGVINPTDSHLNFVLEVNRYGQVECTDHNFEYGAGDVSYAPYLVYTYDVEQHGGL